MISNDVMKTFQGLDVCCRKESQKEGLVKWMSKFEFVLTGANRSFVFEMGLFESFEGLVCDVTVKVPMYMYTL